MIAASAICFRLLMHLICWAFFLALLKEGRSMPARIAMMAITTRSSISVKPLTRDLRGVWPRIQYCWKSFIRPPFQLNVHLTARIYAIGAEHFHTVRKAGLLRTPLRRAHHRTKD